MKFTTLLVTLLFAGLPLTAQSDNLLSDFSTEALMLPEGSAFARHRTAQLATNVLADKADQTLRLDLFKDVSYDVALDRRPNRHALAGHDIYWGTTGDPAWAHLPHYRDVVMVVNRTTEKMILYAMTTDGTFMVVPTIDKNFYNVYQEAAIDWDSQPCADQDKGVGFPQDKLLMGDYCLEQDAAGVHVVDMFFSFSHEAEGVIGDIYAHALAQTETVNQGLANSEIDNIRLRVVDLAVKDNFTGIVSDVLDANLALYEAEMEAVGADMLADFQTPRPDVVNSGGWGTIGGRSCNNSATGPTVFRHEWGHNSGSNHCTGGVSDYAAGYDNGNVQTHMCGNTINFYSNPELTDAQGRPLGDLATADNARSIRERAGLISGYRRHVLPYDAQDTGMGNCAAGIADGAYYIQNVATGQYLTPNFSGFRGQYLTLSATNTNLKDSWEVHDQGDGRVMIYNRNRSTVIDIFGGQSAPGQHVGTWDIVGSTNQTFRLLPTGNGNNVFIQSAANTLYLSVDQDNQAVGDTIIQDMPDGTDFDQWGFVPVTPAATVVSLDVTTTNSGCTNATTGSATVTVTGDDSPTIAWRTGSSAAMIDNLNPGSYTVTVTSGGKEYFSTGVVRGNPALFAELDVQRATQLSGARVEVTNVVNGTPPYTYAWSDGGATTAIRDDIAQGDHDVTVTDANGCTEVRPFRVSKTLAVSQYFLQHVATGLMAVDDGTDVVLATCEDDNSRFLWNSTDEGGNTAKFRNQQSGSMLTVFGRPEAGATYWTGGDGNVRPHKHDMISTGDDTWVMRNQLSGFYTMAKDAAEGTLLTHEDVTEAEADEWRLVEVAPCAIVLPVELTEFTGTVREKDNLLRWTTATETDNAGFYLQRSADGINFIDLDFVPGSGTTTEGQNYTYPDEAPLAGTSFYRLRQVDLDGTASLSEVVALTRAAGAGWSVYPNPVRGTQQLSVSLTEVRLSLHDLSGRLLRRISRPQFSLSGVQTGVYLLRNEADGSVRRIVKTK